MDQSGEVFKGIGSAGFAGLDQTHEDVSDTGAIGCLVKQTVFSVEDGLFKNSFAKVVVQGGAGCLEEPSERLPVFEHVFEGGTPRPGPFGRLQALTRETTKIVANIAKAVFIGNPPLA